MVRTGRRGWKDSDIAGTTIVFSVCSPVYEYIHEGKIVRQPAVALALAHRYYCTVYHCHSLAADNHSVNWGRCLADKEVKFCRNRLTSKQTLTMCLQVRGHTQVGGEGKHR